MWVLGLQSSEGWRGSRQGRHARRYVLAAADPAYLDPQQAALGHVWRRRSGFRGAATRVAQLGVSADEDFQRSAGDRSRAPGSSQAPENRSAPSRARQRWQQAGSSAAVRPPFRAPLGWQKDLQDTPRVGRAKSRTWGGTRQNRRARRRERRAAPRILPPDGVRLAGGSPEAGGTDL